MSTPRRIPWHRLLGQALTDALIGLPYRVNVEEELALRSQRLDVLIIEQARGADTAAPDVRPDGLQNLAKHNLLSFKAAGQAFDAWAYDELNSHYVTYRKLASIRALGAGPAGEDAPLAEPRQPYALLPEAEFRCYAIAARFPRQLVQQLLPGSCQSTGTPGLYDLRAGARTVCLVVLNQLAPHPRNAPWGLFASDATRRRAALAQYRPRTPIGMHLHNLMTDYFGGDGQMAYTYDDMHREALEWLTGLIGELDPEEVLKHYGPEDRLKGLDPEDRLKGLDPALIEAWLAQQRRDH